jgi:hypothetical protein
VETAALQANLDWRGLGADPPVSQQQSVYFPRLIVPVATVITSFVDFLISFVILAGLMLWYQWWPLRQAWARGYGWPA